LLLGANDACIPLPTSTQGVPLDEFKANLKTIITHRNIMAHKPKIFLVTPPPLDEVRITVADKAWGHSQATRQAGVSAMYSETVRQVAAEVPGTEVLDLQQAVMEKAISMTPGFDAKSEPALGYPGGRSGALEQLLPDGLHLSGEAYRVFFDLVKERIGSSFPNDSSEGYVFPDWRQLNPGSI
jgi:lysophospholipase L1-like esterase